MSRISILFNSFKYKKQLNRKNVRTSIFAVYDNKCTFGSNIHIDRFSILHNCTVGSYTYITTNCEISNCSIGKFCSIAGGVKIGLGKHPMDRLSTSPVFYSFKNRLGIKWNEDDTVIENVYTNIENDVWIGTNAIVVGGITIGTGSVIAAGAVVTKDVPPYAIVAGVPAKIINYRFDNEKVKKILDSKWWDLPENELINIAKTNGQIEKFM